MAPPLRSTLLADHGFEHGFSLRDGGPTGLPEDPGVYQVNQVHGRGVVKAVADDLVESLRQTDADALVANETGVAVGVRTADCVPLLIADPASGTVAAVHAGWRGTVDGVVTAAADALDALAGPREGWLVGMFPHIRICCFEVGSDVAHRLGAMAPGAPVVDTSHPRPHVNLTAIIVDQLVRLGASPGHIEDVPGCTMCDPERFHSYRRDGAGAGRHVTAIVAGR